MNAASHFPREVPLNDFCMVFKTFLVEKYILVAKVDSSQNISTVELKI